MELQSNMVFEMKSSFLPNISRSDTLRILEVTNRSVIVQMHDSNCRGVFPLDSFHYWIKKNGLIQKSEAVEKTS